MLVFRDYDSGVSDYLLLIVVLSVGSSQRNDRISQWCERRCGPQLGGLGVPRGLTRTKPMVSTTYNHGISASEVKVQLEAATRDYAHHYL